MVERGSMSGWDFHSDLAAVPYGLEYDITSDCLGVELKEIQLKWLDKRLGEFFIPE
jgi:hypothetical protein